MSPAIEAFFDPSTFTYSYVVSDRESGRAAIIDPVLDYDPASGRTSTDSAERILDYLQRNELKVDWILENPCARRPSDRGCLSKGEGGRARRHWRSGGGGAGVLRRLL